MCYFKKFCFLFSFFILSISAEAAEPDSIIIKTFSAGDYKATSINYSAVEGEDGVVYFANESGVLAYDGSEWTLISVKDFSAVTALLAKDERIFVGAGNELGYIERNAEGVYEYTSLRHLLELPREESVGFIWQIVSVGKDIYFSSMEMLLRYDGTDIHKIDVKKAYIFAIGEKLFVSPAEKGLALVVKDSLHTVNKEFSLKDDNAFGYLKGLKGEQLLVTADNGIFEIDTSTYKTRPWKGKENDFLKKNSVYFGLTWQDSLYAFSTAKSGLFFLNREGEIVKSFNKENGLTGTYLREMVTDKRGNLWVTSDSGLNYLQPYSSENDSSLLKTVIRSVSGNEQNLPFSSRESELVLGEAFTGTVVFHYATPGFHKDELEYSYFLEGFEEGWSNWKSDVKKEYTNLNGGSYTFHVKARYKGKTESLKASLPISIPTPWFKTTPAFILGFLLLSTVILSGVHYRTKRLHLLNKRLGKIISNRTQELVEQREQLRATNNELRIKNIELDNFVYRSSHDLVAPLKSLKGLINVAQLEKEIGNQEIYFRLMHSSVDKLEDFIKSIMEYSSNSKKELVKENIDLNLILDCIFEDLKYYKRIEKIDLIRNIEEGTRFCTDSKRLKIILSNLITNSIKYHNYQQDKPTIEIKSQLKDEDILIHVIDNGRGIEEAYLPNIFDMFFRATDSAEGSGLGLYIVKDTVKKLGGEISVASEYRRGTTFTLRFPRECT
ncbi:ATP-binding protein [Nafulsella turpanensis]|uniref:ATP-binding protein n=1 Tax=Nafulsella turpanensis TaxID=1265690 RepID=UPI00034DEF9D|nr:ATP-binding protein [Nafulsella turpanensis]